MDKIINAVDLNTVIPGYRAIAQSYTDSRSAIDRFMRGKDRQPAAEILKPAPLSRRICGRQFCHNPKKLH
ncbi:hypothetical protein [Microcoleus sp. Pol12B4]|uniref:hypothetical protein n=1 Tax=Microcoleus sp. Pol12B4 TaxID=3055395 RepID=UPI002FD44D91